MKGRESKGPPSADLLVCFPPRAHLSLIPKPICSPAKPSEPNNRHHLQPHHRRHHHHHLRKLSSRGGGGPGGQASPVLWSKTKPMGSDISEPTSPKVTCAGQIKVRPKASSCKNWQSVMEEIERLHINNRKQKKRSTSWVEALGLKKDAMQFLACLRRIRFDFRCFGSFPSSDLTSDGDEDEEEDDEDEDYQKKQAGAADRSDVNEASRTVFSKWFMVLQDQEKLSTKEDQPVVVAACDPPPNALLLMRCRSAPAKTRLKEREAENDDDEDEDEDEDREEEEEKKAKLAMAKEKKRSKSLAMVMKCDTDFYKFSTDIVKETWVVGGIRDPLMARSRSSR